MCGTRADAEDLLQEIFLQAYRKIGSFKGDSSYAAITDGSVSMRKRTGSAGCYNATTFKSAVLHELGHTLGLDHGGTLLGQRAGCGRSRVPGDGSTGVAVVGMGQDRAGQPTRGRSRRADNGDDLGGGHRDPSGRAKH